MLLEYSGWKRSGVWQKSSLHKTASQKSWARWKKLYDRKPSPQRYGALGKGAAGPTSAAQVALGRSRRKFLVHRQRVRGRRAPGVVVVPRIARRQCRCLQPYERQRAGADADRSRAGLPGPAVTVTSVEPVTGVTPLLTVKLTVTFSGFVFGVVPVMVVVVASGVAVVDCSDSPCCRRWSGPTPLSPYKFPCRSPPSPRCR